VAPDGKLRLRAEDGEDLAVVSAIVQDALISTRDLTYDRAEKRFTLVVNRFRWEGPPAAANGEAAFERTHCAVTFAAVDKVSYRGFRRSETDRILALLAIRAGVKPETIDLEFAGGAAVRLSVSAIDARVTDLGEPWPTAWQPDHDANPAS
jgi:hypothetical protein